MYLKTLYCSIINNLIGCKYIEIVVVVVAAVFDLSHALDTWFIRDARYRGMVVDTAHLVRDLHLPDHCLLYRSAGTSYDQLLPIHSGNDTDHKRYGQKGMLYESPADGLLHPRLLLHDHGHSLQFTCGQNGLTLLTILELHAYDLEGANRYRSNMDDDWIHLSHQD